MDIVASIIKSRECSLIALGGRGGLAVLVGLKWSNNRRNKDQMEFVYKDEKKELSFWICCVTIDWKRWIWYCK
jgi:hypothetical protein